MQDPAGRHRKDQVLPRVRLSRTLADSGQRPGRHWTAASAETTGQVPAWRPFPLNPDGTAIPQGLVDPRRFTTEVHNGHDL